MVIKNFVVGMSIIILASTIAFPAPAQLKLIQGRVAISHAGNAYDKDATYSMAMDWVESKSDLL